MEKDIHVTKRQHFIPRKYLRGWASDERIWCSFNQTTPKNVNIENVGVGKYFYKFNSDIKSNELMYAKALFNDYPNPELYDFWTDQYMSFANLLNHMSNEDEKKKICNQLEEIINCEIEESFWTFLDQLRNGDSSFYNLYDDKVEFLIGLIELNLRTKNMKNRIIGPIKEKCHEHGINPDNLWMLTRHQYSILISRVLIEKKFNLFILVDDTNGIITGDQPVVNAKPEIIYGEITDLVYYFPLSNSKALLITQDSEIDVHLNEEQRDMYNKVIIENSEDQFYSDREDILKKYLLY